MSHQVKSQSAGGGAGTVAALTVTAAAREGAGGGAGVAGGRVANPWFVFAIGARVVVSARTASAAAAAVAPAAHVFRVLAGVRLGQWGYRVFEP